MAGSCDGASVALGAAVAICAVIVATACWTMAAWSVVVAASSPGEPLKTEHAEVVRASRTIRRGRKVRRIRAIDKDHLLTGG